MIANNSQQKHFTSKIILPVYINPVSAGVIGTATIDQPQKCQLCQKDFPSLLAFQNHLKEHHLDGKIYRNIIVSSVSSPVTMIPAHVATVQHIQQPQQYQITNAVKLEKPIKTQTIIHTSDVIKQAYPSNEYATVTNINMTPVIQQIQIQTRDKDKPSASVVQVVKQNPVEYHIQQQEHAAMIVAQMNQKSGVSSTPFLNSTIKYELSQPLQLVAAEVFPHILTETKPEEQISQSPPPSTNQQQQQSSGPVLSNGETMEKQHKCLICDKFFTTVANLNIHLKSHAGDKPYKCSICQKGFIQSNNLSTHMKTHTGEKPHECSICGKRFSQSNNLKTHYRTHTGNLINFFLLQKC